MLSKTAPYFHWLAPLLFLFGSCGSEPKIPETSPKATAPKPADESRRFPQASLLSTSVIANNLINKTFMPGGTLARYRKGKREYEMFAGRSGSSAEAALLLIDWRKALTAPKFLPSFGGYFGEDSGKPLFVFTKGPWIAGVAGLPLEEADLLARTLASKLGPN